MAAGDGPALLKRRRRPRLQGERPREDVQVVGGKQSGSALLNIDGEKKKGRYEAAFGVL